MIKKYDGKYIVRSESAGVFFGEISGRNGREVHMQNARRLWYWDGASECIQLSVDGTKLPENCKFTIWVDDIEILDVIEIIPAIEKACKSIEGVGTWAM